MEKVLNQEHILDTEERHTWKNQAIPAPSEEHYGDKVLHVHPGGLHNEDYIHTGTTRLILAGDAPILSVDLQEVLHLQSTPAKCMK